MNDFKLLPDDPKLTAYALGELEGDERAAVEAALREDPVARAAVEEIRATAAQLEGALAAEVAAEVKLPPVPLLARAAIIPGSDPYKLDGGPLGKSDNRLMGKLIKFPQVYYVIGGVAAACFAVFVALQPTPPPHVAATQKHYTEVDLTQPPVAAPIELPVAPMAEANRIADASAEKAATPVVSMAVADAMTQSPRTGLVAGNLPLLDQVKNEKLLELQKKDGAATGQVLFSSADKDSVGQTVSDESRAHSNLQTAGIRAQPAAVLAKTQSRVVGAVAIGGVPAAAPASRVDDSKDIVQLSAFGVDSPRGTGNVVATGATAFAPSSPLSSTWRNPKAMESAGGSLPSAPAGNTESYSYQADNDFLSAAQNRLSTFSIDVDTASYSNVRRFLQNGRLPPRDAVRVEEMVNYFPYHYSAPVMGVGAEAEKRGEGTPPTTTSGEAAPFAASMEVADAPWAPTHRLVRIGLKGREVATEARPAANLVFLLDVSGSMNAPNRLPLVKESMRLLVGKLRRDDRVAIVTYAGQSGLALPSTPVAKSAEILAALDALTPGGSTNGAMGIQLAYDVAKANLVPGGINRVILCTDGDFNVGVTSEGELVRLIEEKAKSGVALTALGFGMGNYKDSMIEKLADKGDGNYGYIDTRREAEKLLVEQVSGTLMTIAKDVKVQVEFNPAKVASYRLIGYENRLLKKEDFNNDQVDAGEIGAGHAVTALYEIVPVGAENDPAAGVPAVDELKYAPKVANARASVSDSNELLTLKLRYKQPTGDVSSKLEFALRDAGRHFAEASADFKFAAAVAEFAMILRDSPHKGGATLGDVLAWAAAGTVRAEDDASGYRGEFLDLVRKAQTLMR